MIPVKVGDEDVIGARRRVFRQAVGIIADAGAGIAKDDFVTSGLDLYAGGVGSVGALRATWQAIDEHVDLGWRNKVVLASLP